MVSIKEITDKKIWEDFNLKNSQSSFLQSWAWGEFQKSLDNTIQRIGIYDDNSLVGICLVYEQKAKTGAFLYCPAGPIFSDWNQKYLSSWLDFVAKTAKQQNITFLRVDPRLIEKSQASLLRNFGFRSAPEYTQPQCSAIIDLNLSEKDILEKMSSSTRYNIGMSQRKGVVVRESEDIKIFLEFLQETAKKRALVLPAQTGYHKKQFEVLSKEGLMKLTIARYQGEPLAAALVTFYADTAYYLHAANSYHMSKLRSSYPLVWHSILEAKKAGLKKFDFWGVAENDDPKHEWSGITSFKLSFGAERIFYEPPFDLPYKGTYRLVRLIESLRKPFRRILRT